MKQKFGFTSGQVINQNFLVSMVDLAGVIALVYLSYKVHPFKILKGKLYLFFLSIISFPFIISHTNNPTYILVFQCLAALFVFDHVPAAPIFYKYFPVLKRFTYTSFLSAFAKLLTYFITSFGLVYMMQYLGYWGLFLIFIPVGIAFAVSVSYFQRLEESS